MNTSVFVDCPMCCQRKNTNTRLPVLVRPRQLGQLGGQVLVPDNTPSEPERPTVDGGAGGGGGHTNTFSSTLCSQ